jgi:hypothetical protein
MINEDMINQDVENEDIKNDENSDGVNITDKEYEEIEKIVYIQNQMRLIINATKYLKKTIKKLPKYYLSNENKHKLFMHYNELVDMIIDQIQ